MSVLAALGLGGWALALVIVVLFLSGFMLIAGVLFIPAGEPSKRAERLLRAWRGVGPADEPGSTP